MSGLSANVLYVLVGTVLFGISAGLLGTFVVLRRQALIGDALAHAALPGICLAFLLSGGMKHPVFFICGAVVTGLLGSLAMRAIVRQSRIKEDTALGLVLSVFFGVGILLLTYIQHQPFGNQSGIDRFLFGQAAAIVGRDLWLFGGIAGMVICAVMVMYKELKVLVFDPDFARSIGLPLSRIDMIVLVLTVLVVTAGLQSVGVVLMAAMLVTPAVAARQWTDRLGAMLGYSAVFGALASMSGTGLSTLAPHMPTGPWIVVCATAIFALSLVMAPHRGIAPRWWRHRQTSHRIHEENTLRTLYRLVEDGRGENVSIAMMQQYRAISLRQGIQILARLERRGFVIPIGDRAAWHLTSAGLREAERLVRRHRLWEVYLSRYLQLGPGAVHAGAEDIEHILTPELEARLEAVLQHPAVDPHARKIPYATGEER
ncbi:MAG: metal ABC transporter permease [Deltaproteobacteria bacterium]|nr:metal ABC transporter permease [Deltaproteobacteria bacterium]